jgi:hypothetical protein
MPKRLGSMARIGFDAVQFSIQLGTPVPDQKARVEKQDGLQDQSKDYRLQEPTGDDGFIHTPIILSEVHVSTIKIAYGRVQRVHLGFLNFLGLAGNWG